MTDYDSDRKQIGRVIFKVAQNADGVLHYVLVAPIIDEFRVES